MKRSSVEKKAAAAALLSVVVIMGVLVLWWNADERLPDATTAEPASKRSSGDLPQDHQLLLPPAGLSMPEPVADAARSMVVEVRPASKRLVGRVLECSTDTPLCDVIVEAVMAGGGVFRAISDLDGRVTFEMEGRFGRAGATVLIYTVGGPFSERESVRVIWKGGDDEAFVLRHCTSGSRQGTLLMDAVTGEPVPCFAVIQGLTAATAPGLTWTHSNGRFGAGKLVVEPNRIQLVDHPGLARFYEGIVPSWKTDQRGEPVLQIRVGPTFSLRGVSTGGKAYVDMRARLRPVGEARDVNSRRQVEAGVTDGPLPWVRFPPRDEIQGDRLASWVVDLESADGLHGGSARVRQVVGIQREPLDIVLRPRSVVRGRIIEGQGVAGPDSWVDLVAEFSVPSEAPGVVTTSPSVEGQFEFRSVVPGRYRLIARTSDTGIVAETTVIALPERVVVVDLVNAATKFGTISGSVYLDSETPVVCQIVLQDQSSGVAVARRTVELALTGGRQVGQFEFEGVRQADYQVKVRTDDWIEWKPEEFVVHGGVHGIAFIGTRPSDTVDVAFDVSFDRKVSDDLRVMLGVTYPSGATSIREYPRNDARVRQVPQFARLKWSLTAEGCEIRHGDVAVAALARDAVNGVAHIKVLLRSGWGNLIEVLDESSRPLAGIEVIVDGISVGITDRSGIVVAFSIVNSRSHRIELRPSVWVISGGAVDVATGNLIPVFGEAIKIVARRTR
jgi:hypothetical protein